MSKLNMSTRARISTQKIWRFVFGLTAAATHVVGADARIEQMQVDLSNLRQKAELVRKLASEWEEGEMKEAWKICKKSGITDAVRGCYDKFQIGVQYSALYPPFVSSLSFVLVFELRLHLYFFSQGVRFISSHRAV